MGEALVLTKAIIGNVLIGQGRLRFAPHSVHRNEDVQLGGKR
jgi:hypothetical protein